MLPLDEDVVHWKLSYCPLSVVSGPLQNRAAHIKWRRFEDLNSFSYLEEGVFFPIEAI